MEPRTRTRAWGLVATRVAIARTGLTVTVKGMTVPYVREPYHPNQASTEAIAEMRADLERERSAQEAFAAANRARQRALLSVGDSVRDIEAALACQCSCHPRVSAIHGGGATCPCQLSSEERAERVEEAFKILLTLREPDDERSEREATFAACAAALGVEIRSYGGMAPFTIHGVVDGRAFWFRERHDLWRVEIAPDEQPLADLEQVHAFSVIVVGEGGSEDLEQGNAFDVAALQVACDAVRLFLLRRECVHETHLLGGAAARFCGACGVEIASATRWRVFTQGEAEHG